ncbi:uncharacterized protein LOC129457370 [Periophthalmus magnuspinnatus]|uniref:uncharacterized protein LOC129457370 n=1 Tax=Periophthalmus magnuspinnatus TaxID=409849 RepID=UPI0024371FBF|nr:uncharacterized protein LOC129457370 [Periophthalmus magnuspinnatus]
MVESLKLCLQLLMLLGKMIYNQSAVQHCPLQNIVSNFTTEAGSPFHFSILLNATQTHLGNLKISLANGNLPPWVEYRQETGHLVGLALPEDCGIHHIQLHITTHNCTANLFVHVRNTTIHGNSPKRDMLPCPDREISIWGNLLLDASPVHLNASRRIHLVNTVADLLHLQGNSISLFSSKNFNVYFHEMLKVCSPTNLHEDLEKAATFRNLTQLLWRFGCRSQEQLFFLQDKFSNAFVRDILMKQLDIPVFALRLLCTVEVAHKVKRDLRLDLSTFLSQLSSTTAQRYTASEAQTFAQTNDITLNHFVQSSDTFASDHTESDMGTLLLSFEDNITPVFPTQLHVTTNFPRLPTSLTSGSDQGWSDIWTETYWYSHSESARPVPLKSLDLSDFRQESSGPSVSDSHQTETYGVSLSFSTDRSHQSSNAILLSQMFSPTPHLSHPSNTEQTDPKIPPTVSGAWQEAISQINATLRDLTLTTLVSQAAQNTLESSMHVFLTTGPTTYTPPLPFAYSTSEMPNTYDYSPTFSSGGHSSSDITKLSTSSVTATSTVNFPPQVLQTIPALTATVGFPFSYSIPENTFVDPEDGAADALSLEMRLIDPPPPSVGSWLSLDGLKLHENTSSCSNFSSQSDVISKKRRFEDTKATAGSFITPRNTSSATESLD